MGLTPGEPLSAAAVEQMQMDLESMKEFETTILTVLDDLTNGDIVIDDPVAGRLKWAHYGTGFDEAMHIALSSSFMVEEVRKFARMLRAQIEAMALTIRMAGDKTAATEESVRRQLALLIYGEPGKDPTYNVEPVPAVSAAPVAPPAAPGTPVSPGSSGTGDAGVG